MIAHSNVMTVEAFDQYVLLPENRDRLMEFMNGEILDVVSSGTSSSIGLTIGGLLAVFVRQHGLGWTTGADGVYMVGNARYIPDAAFVAKSRQAAPTRAAYNPIPPDLAVEVISPTDSRDALRLKIANYLAARATVWLVDPDNEKVEVYRPGQPPEVLGVEGVLSDDKLLPDFQLPVKDIFAS